MNKRVLVGLLACSSAWAQSFGAVAQTPAPKLTVKVPIHLQLAERVGLDQRGQGEFDAATSKPLGSNAALSNFRLSFTNGDHKIRGIGLMPNDEVVRVRFSDIDRNDPFRARANWWLIPGAVGGVVDFPAGSSTSNPIPPGPANSTLAIAGFVAWMQGHHDCNIVRFEVGFNQQQNRMTIVQGSDCNESIYKQGAYVWIPNAALAGNYTVTGSLEDRLQASGTLPANERYVLRGFRFEFQNGSHYLMHMSVNLDSKADSHVWWRDINTDDPVQWRVDYSVLK